MEKTIDAYLKFQESNKNLSHNTILSYQRDLYAFYNYLKENSVTVKRVKKSDVMAYISYLRQKGKSDATVTRAFASIRSYYKYLLVNGNMKKDPTVGIAAPKPEKKLPGILSFSEVERFLSEPKGKNFKEIRDKAILELLYATGIRVSTLIELTIDNLDMDNRLLIFEEGDKQRIVPFGAQAYKSLDKYLNDPKYQENDNTYIFTNLYGKKLSRQGFWKIIKYYKEKAGIKKDITPQILRHSFAAHLMDNGIDNLSLQELMGYSSIASVKKYEELSGKRIIDIYKKVHPRA